MTPCVLRKNMQELCTDLKSIYKSKTKEEATQKALSELKVAEENLIINILEEKNTLLKKSIKIEVINYNDITEEYLIEKIKDKELYFGR